MKKILMLLAVAVLLASMVLLIGCGAATITDTGSGTTSTSAEGTTETSEEGAGGQTTETSEEGEEASSEVTVDIQNFSFNPDSITVKRGGKVTWTNRDSVGHTATADNGEFDSGILNNGQSFTQTFNEAGEFKYHCTPHPQMTATVVVE